MGPPSAQNENVNIATDTRHDTSESSPSLANEDGDLEDDFEYDDFTDYMDEYIQRELDAQIQSQLDHQISEYQRQADDQLQRHLDDAIGKDAELFRSEMFECDRHRGIIAFDDDKGGEAEIEEMILLMNLEENSAVKTKSIKKGRTTVDDIDKAIRRIADNIKKDEEGRQTGKHQRLWTCAFVPISLGKPLH